MADPIKIAVGKGATKSFDSLEQVENWLTGERAFWNKLTEQSYRRNVPQELVNHIEHCLNPLRNTLNEAKQRDPSDQARFVATVLSLKAQANDVFEQKGFFSSGSPEAKFIAELLEKDGDAVASYAAAYLLGVTNVTFDRLPSISGAFEAFSFQSGFKKRGQAEAAALEEMRKEWEKKFQSLKEEHQSTINTQRATTEQQKVDSAAQYGEARKFLEAVQKKWDELTKFYKEELALAAPVAYWKNRAQQHIKWGAAYGVASLIFGIVAAILLKGMAKEFLTAPANADAATWKPEYWRLATVLIYAALAVWIFRILIKLFLSKVHLQIDAQERVTMAQTYLSLLEAKKITDDERKMIIAALFRPTSTGVVRDEGLPLVALDALTKAPKG